MSTHLVFFLHRLGVKAYQVSADAKVTELVDVISTDLDELSSKLSQFSGENSRLLISDTISYLFHSQIPRTPVGLTRDVVFQKIKNEVPENFESTNWDYKIVGTNDDSTEVLVFAPVLEFQNLITSLANKLRINFEVIEPESISVTRHPNPIVGIVYKDDLGAKDEQTLNISVAPTGDKSSPKFPKAIIFVIGLLLFVTLNIFLYSKYQQSKNIPPVDTIKVVPTATPTTIVPSPAITPTSIVQKSWPSLKFAVQNGSGKTGYATQVATKLKDSGIVEVITSNADRGDYSESMVIFATEDIKNTHLSKLNSIFPIKSPNVKVDKGQSYDAILILGIN